MAASDHLGYQLRLFVDPQEHIDELTASTDLITYGNAAHMWATKLNESLKPEGTGHGSGVYKSVAAEGVHTPINVQLNKKNELIQHEGHHRLISAATAQEMTGRQQWVPVQYQKSWSFFPVSAQRMTKNDRSRLPIGQRGSSAFGTDPYAS